MKAKISHNIYEANAKTERVDDRVIFREATALRLPFEDEYVDAAVSRYKSAQNAQALKNLFQSKPTI